MSAVAVFNTNRVTGEVVFRNRFSGVIVSVSFTKLPPGEHGFHIHKGGDLRGLGFMGLCSHFHVGEPKNHGGPPGVTGDRHTGDLGNVRLGPSGKFEEQYYLHNVKVEDLYGRSVVVHADPDDYGKGGKEDSLKTGNSGARIACAIIGRIC